MNQWDIHAALYNVLGIISCLIIGICARYNQGFGYASIGFCAFVGFYWAAQLFCQLSGIYFPIIFAVIVYALGCVGAIVGLFMISRSKGRPQSLMGRNVLMVFAGGYAFSWLLGQVMVFFVHTYTPYWISFVLYVLYVIGNFFMLLNCLKGGKIKDPYPCEIPRRYARGRAKASAKKNEVQMTNPNNNQQQLINQGPVPYQNNAPINQQPVYGYNGPVVRNNENINQQPYGNNPPPVHAQAYGNADVYAVNPQPPTYQANVNAYQPPITEVNVQNQTSNEGYNYPVMNESVANDTYQNGNENHVAFQGPGVKLGGN